jgi:hypothetical protein
MVPYCALLLLLGHFILKLKLTLFYEITSYSV